MGGGGGGGGYYWYICYAYVQNAKKLEHRSKEGSFVGYDKKSPAYLVYIYLFLFLFSFAN
jgi:hypothetical protein